MMVKRKTLKAIGIYAPGDVMELEERDATAFDLLQITAPCDAVAEEAPAAEDAEVAAAPRRVGRAYKRRDMRAGE
jgi:hypothetical protein